MKLEPIYGIHRGKTTIIGNCVFVLKIFLSNRNYMYYSRVIRQRMLTEIATILEVGTEEVSAKLHSLKTQFNRESNREKKQKSGSAGEDTYVSKWEYLSSLKFLNVGSIPGETVSNLVYFVKLFVKYNMQSTFLENITVSECRFDRID